MNVFFSFSRAVDSSNSVSEDGDERRGKELVLGPIGACDFEISGDKLRRGHFTTRNKAKSYKVCRLVLQGTDFDKVHFSLTSYMLR